MYDCTASTMPVNVPMMATTGTLCTPMAYMLSMSVSRRGRRVNIHASMLQAKSVMSPRPSIARSTTAPKSAIASLSRPITPRDAVGSYDPEDIRFGCVPRTSL